MKYTLKDVMNDLENLHGHDAWKKLDIVMKELREMHKEHEHNTYVQQILEEILGE